MGLKWSAIFCPQAKYVMKTDDDIFVNVPLLHEAVAKTQKQFATRINGKSNIFHHHGQTFTPIILFKA